MDTSRANAAPRRGAALLGPDDAPPYARLNAQARARAVLVCDHASWAVPPALAGLGLDEAVLKRHIGWDIGAGDVARRLAHLVDAPAVLAGYSRLVIDCNRPLGSPESIPAASDGVEIPGNRDVDATAAEARAAAVFRPYHACIERSLVEVEARHGGPAAVVAVHTFTPVLEGVERPWHVGVLWDRDERFARGLTAALGREPGLRVGDNEPYSGRVPIPYSVPAHAVAAGRPHVTVEIRQDLVDTHHGAEAWARRLAGALAQVLADSGLYRVLDG